MRGRFITLAVAVAVAGCTIVGPDFDRPEAEAMPEWPAEFRDHFEFDPQREVEWWLEHRSPAKRLIDVLKVYMQRLTIERTA